MRKLIVICKRDTSTSHILEAFDSFKKASVASDVPIKDLRRCTKYGRGKGGRTAGFLWTKHWANPILLHLKEPDDLELAVFATCAQCSGMDESDEFMSEEVLEDIKYCPCKCYLLTHRNFRNKDY